MQKKVSNILSVAQLYASNKMIENVYIHLPFCQKKCHFCAFPIHALGKKTERETL
jgi:coproporphyrinogen III oxidase-like Fe-S oxidoreductase